MAAESAESGEWGADDEANPARDTEREFAIQYICVPSRRGFSPIRP